MNTGSLTKNGTSQRHNAVLRILYWNAGGLSNTKFLELKQSIYSTDADIYFIVEAGLASDNPEYYQSRGYNTKLLKRSRQVASGIIIGIKDSLISDFNIIHEMDETDKMEAVHLKVWKNRKPFNLICLYNPPGNQPNTEILELFLSPNSIFIGDFNCPSTRWGYNSTTTSGKHLEQFLDDNLLDVLDTPPTFLSYAGSLSRPDLIIAHPNMSDKINTTLMDDAGGCGHKAIFTTVRIGNGSDTPKRTPRWNFKKARWNEYKTMTNTLLGNILLHPIPEKAANQVTQVLLKCAHKCVPRGQVKKFKPFWNKTLTDRKSVV